MHETPPSPLPGETHQQSRNEAQGLTKRALDLAIPPPKRIRGQSWQGNTTSMPCLVLEVGPFSNDGARNLPTGPMGPRKRRRLDHDTQSAQVDPTPTPNASLRYLEYVRRGIILGTPGTGASQHERVVKSKGACSFSYH